MNSRRRGNRPRRGLRLPLACATTFLLVGALAACGGDDATGDADAKGGVEGATVRVAFSALPSAIDVVTVKALELLEEDGVTVEILNLDGGALATQAVIGGRADIAATALPDAVNGGLVAFALARPRNMYALIAQPEYQTVESLDGTIIAGGEPGDVQNILTEAILEKYGMSVDDVTLANIGGSGDRTTALLSGRVNATMVYGDNHVRLTEAGYHTITSAAEEFPGLVDDLLVASPDWLEKNPDVATAVAEAQLEAAQWFAESPEEWLDLALETVTGLEEATAQGFYELAEGLDMYPTDGLLSEDSLQQTYEMLLEADVIEVTDFDAWATTEFMDAARDNLGIEAP
jgi:NitT/TauT family transport system substrate-binding protein